MTESNTQKTIWFIYDGKCPLCSNAALAFKIKQAYGNLQLINARTEQDHTVVRALFERQLDLDAGMVIYDGAQFYHGQQALSFMARFSEAKGVFNLVNKALFWSPALAHISYPWMRHVRNYLLHRRKISQIDNLNRKSEPIFKHIFGESWHQLPPVMQKHYLNRPYTNDLYIVEGKLDVMCAGPMKWFAPLLWLTGGVPPMNEKNVPVTVRFESHPNTQSFTFNRTFHFANRRPYRFKSEMLQLEANKVVELMRFGIGWQCSFHWENGCVKLKHEGYVFKCLGHYLPVPLTLLIGEGNATETPIDDDTFAMQVDITHPWWGNIYQYKGQFRLQGHQ